MKVSILWHEKTDECGTSRDEIIDIFSSKEQAENARTKLIKEDIQRVTEEAEAHCVKLEEAMFLWRHYTEENTRVEEYEVK